MELINSQNSDVAILGDVVIRRPRHSEAIAGVRREATVLPRLRHRLVLPVPEMQIVEISDQIIALHQRLPGKPLRSVQDLTDQTQSRLAVQLGNFLQSLHQFVERLASTYPTIEALLERSPFYCSLFAVMDALFGAEHGDSATLDFGLETINQIV